MPTATAIDPQTLVRDCVRNIAVIATLPEITSQIITIVEDPRSSAGKLHALIAHDPALVARILKVVNSSLYGLAGKVASVDRAIVMLGLNAVKNIAVATSLGQMFRGSRLCEGFAARDLWTHCVGVAVISRELAKQMKLPLAEEAFLAGMIHDLGILIALQSWPEKVRTVCETVKSREGNFCEIERQVLGVDHQMLGRGITEHWKFPAACQQVATFHHEPAAADEASRTLVAIVHAADTLCCQSGKGFNLTAIHQPLDEAAMKAAGIEMSAVEEVRSHLAEHLAGAAAFSGG